MEVFNRRSDNSCLLSGGEIDLDVCDTLAFYNIGQLPYLRHQQLPWFFHSRVNLGHSVYQGDIYD